MALSVVIKRTGPDWPLGYINVPANGTPVGIMSLVDPQNKNSPTASPSPSNAGSEYTTRFRVMTFWGFHPGAANNGLVVNTGNVYLLCPGNGSGNRTDAGAVVGIITPGNKFDFPSSFGSTSTQFSPYGYVLDSDVNNEGALVVGFQPQGQ